IVGRWLLSAKIQISSGFSRLSTVMWVFGYGSLLWKVDFPYKDKKMGYIEGFTRRFWQASHDHRGIPEKPGRVVTLVPSTDPKEKLWGMAYEIAEENVEDVSKHLDFREKNGYQSFSVQFTPKDDQAKFNLKIYIATEDNFAFLGPAKSEEIAAQIYESVGPSGKNTEYLFELANSVRNLFPHTADDHLFELERLVKHMCSASCTTS
ncbi:unnamed protein product, partial [Owenia fusiformis]